MEVIMGRSLRRKSHKKKFLAGGLMLLIMCGAAGFCSWQMKQEREQYERHMKELDKKLEEEQARTEEISEYEEYVTSDEYVEQVARDKLGLVYDDEVLLKANEDSYSE